jgi:hypothetical protein
MDFRRISGGGFLDWYWSPPKGFVFGQGSPVTRKKVRKGLLYLRDKTRQESPAS